MTLLIKSATIIDKTSPFHNQTKDILIENGIILKIENSIENKGNFEEIQLDNLHISQGWFDTSVCFGEPGFEERETIENGLNTAAKSGFTAVAVNPNTSPVADNKATIEFIKNKACGFATSLYPLGSLTKNSESEDIAELFDMKNYGAIAFGDYKKPISNANLLKISLQYAQNFDGLIMSYPQDNSIARNGLVNEEKNSTRLGLKGLPALAEEMQIARDLFILEYTSGKLHIPSISTAKSVQLIKDAKKKGLQVTCSVTAHNLVLTDDELMDFDSNTKVLPPLRTSKDINALIKGLNDGVIDIITSDHNPIDIEHKKVEYSNAKFGTIGLESLFGALNKVIDTDVLIASLTTNPRKIFNIEINCIKVGEKADLTLFNPDDAYTFTEAHILSTSKNSIFLNKKLTGRVYGVIANNKTIL
ncbi:dihydroorotase [Lutibacter agarilyticus]|uniref:Dihydroorotase n=1 Tax=Lutibacter agarilyticus TaxID=1109740 RepID=A0A238XM12_9FLAO|nr:dihydroorotase [Lutibacter agarilyticus]SNR59374.1 dihydroorotase [Lutibacter agarilyticus]